MVDVIVKLNTTLYLMLKVLGSQVLLESESWLNLKNFTFYNSFNFIIECYLPFLIFETSGKNQILHLRQLLI